MFYDQSSRLYGYIKAKKKKKKKKMKKKRNTHKHTYARTHARTHARTIISRKSDEEEMWFQLTFRKMTGTKSSRSSMTVNAKELKPGFEISK